MEKIGLKDCTLHAAYRTQKLNNSNFFASAEGYELIFYPGSHVSIKFVGKGKGDGSEKLIPVGNIVGMTALGEIKEDKKSKK